MQCGNVVPSPTINDTPHAFAPRIFANQRLLHALYVGVPVSSSYSLAMTTRPAPCEVVSHVAQGNPNWNGSVPAWPTAPSSAFFRSATRAARDVSSPGGSPAWAIALYRS